MLNKDLPPTSPSFPGLASSHIPSPPRGTGDGGHSQVMSQPPLQGQESLFCSSPGSPPRDTVPQEQAAPAGIPHGLTSPARSHFHGPAGPSYGLGASLRHLLLRLELQVGPYSIPASAGAPSAFSSSSGRAPGGSGQQRLLGLSPGRALPQSGSANGLREPRGCCRGWASPALAAIG